MKDLSFAAAVLAAASFGAAHAAVTTTADADPATPDLVVGEAALVFNGDFLNDEMVAFSQEFLAGPIAAGALADIQVTFSDGFPAGFDNLVVAISSAAGDFSFNITEDVPAASNFGGNQLIDGFAFDLMPGDTFIVTITGTAFARGQSRAAFELAFSATDEPVGEVPLPASGLLLASAVAGYGAFRRRGARKP